MKSDVPLDYAVFQLSPRRSRCELFVSYDGDTEKLASGSVKPFVTHLKVAEEQFASAVKSIKLEVDRRRKSDAWFTKGTLERFVRFVGSPEVLELVNTFDTEMSQLEAARKIYSQGSSDGSGGDGRATTASEATKKELLRAIDVRLSAVEQDLFSACTRASAAGFNPDTVSELQLFADQFGAYRLSEACSKFLSLHQRRPEYSDVWKPRFVDHALRSSSGSDMSVDDLAIHSQSGPVLNQHQTYQSEQPDESRITTFQAANKSSLALPLRHSSSRESSIEKEDIKESNDKNEDKREDPLSAKADSRPPSTQPGPPARQLSVKERINLFEKQKEPPSSGSGSKTAAGKSPELSRLPSDVSSAGQAVLRRWSGASDMSIDLSGERKDADSFAGTPTSLVTPKTLGMPITLEDKDRKGSSDTASLLKPETKEISASQNISSGLKNQEDFNRGEIQSKLVKPKVGAQLAVPSGASDEASSQLKLTSSFGRPESSAWKDQNSSEINSKASFGRVEDFSVENQMTSLDFPRKMEQLSSRGKPASRERAADGEASAQNIQVGIPLSRYGHDDMSDGETYEGEHASRYSAVPKSHIRTFQRAAADMTSSSASSLVSSKPNLSQSIEGEVKQKLPKSALEGEHQMARRDYESAEKQHETPSANFEGSGTRSKKIQRPSVHVKKSRSKKEDNDSSSSLPGATGKVIADIQESRLSMSPVPMGQAQRARQPKGNQGLNNELQLKADELEKLFAEHKLRAPGDQSSVTSTRRSKPAETQEKEASSAYKDSSPEPSSSKVASMKMASEPSHSGNAKKFNASPIIQQFKNQDYDVTPKQNTHHLGFSDESKGKQYHKYVQKRDAKLKEEWSLNRAEKESRMKAMHDSLERSKSDMKIKLTASADRLDIHHRVEKLKSYSARSAVRREQPIHSFLSDDNEDQAEFEQDNSTGETFLVDTPSRSAQGKRTSLGNNVASSTPRTSGMPASRSSAKAKASASSGGRRKLQAENPLAQSVPNLSGFKKESPKPSAASSKGITRPKVGNFSRTKSNTDDVLSSKEEKPWRPQHVRKSSATPLELNDLSLLNSEMVEHEYDISRSMEATFTVKGDTYKYARSKASFAAETLDTEDEELENTAKGEDVESIMDEDYSSKDNGNTGSVLSANLGCEDGDTMGIPSRASPTSVAEMPAMLPSAFRSMASVLDSPGESPGSWHSRMHNPFNFQHETSDYDVTVDSPIGSPAYWNQPDSDAARMRKKWGAAQKPNVASDSSNGQSRKDVAKGLKRFLKFGRKTRGADSLADWVSVTTSEGDDDTEDGRGDLANRSSDDLRKSRMGFSHYHPDDGFSETDSFGEQDIAKKTFFSFSTFRSKGSDSKPR